jgi:hypothetical protein
MFEAIRLLVIDHSYMVRLHNRTFLDMTKHPENSILWRCIMAGFSEKLGAQIFKGPVNIVAHKWHNPDTGKDSIYVSLGEGCVFWTSEKNFRHVTEPIVKKGQVAEVSVTPPKKVVTKKGAEAKTNAPKKSSGWTIL